MLGDVGVGLGDPEVPPQRLGPVQQEGVDGHGVHPVDRHLHGAAAAVVLQLGRERGPAEQRDIELRGGRCGRPRRDVLDELLEGIVVFCQTERSQFQNRDNAMKMLRAKLAELKMQQHAEKVSDLKGVQMKIEWGSQIRSYVFMPYTLAKDTRTGYEMGNIQAVMDGDIDGFINAYLTAAANGEIKK